LVTAVLETTAFLPGGADPASPVSFVRHVSICPKLWNDGAMTEAAGTCTAAATARRMWALFEPVHVISYFAPAARQAFEQAGLRGFWRGYFAGRTAPIGAVGAGPVVASFFSFAPAMAARAVPGVWDLVTPSEALAARQAGAVAALRTLLDLGDSEVPAHVAVAAERLAAMISGIGCAGRTLGAANAMLPVPSEPLARLWHAATVLREHRGDGHIAALVAADIDAPEALALRAGVDLAADGAPGHVSAGWSRAQMQPARGWTDEEWDAAAARLAARGLLEPGGAATKAGLTVHREIEHATDVAAARPWADLDDDQASELADLLLPVTKACAQVMPFPNPVGVPAPAASS
jgi:hypothetical protein